jgi:ABC-type glycerol-3-phosphate transport system permease component
MTGASKNLLKSLIFLILLGITIVSIFPIVYIILASFKSNAEILTSGANIFPKEFLTENYVKAWNLGNFNRYTWNSIYMSFFIVIGSIITATTLAYVFDRGVFVGKKFILGLLLSTMFISLGTSSLFPQLQVAKVFGLHTSLWGVILIRVLGINVTLLFIAKGYLATISKEIDEAAKIDGCGFIRIYWNVIFPLLKPLVATIGLLSFRGAWNDYLLPLVFTMAHPERSPLIVGVINLMSTGEAASSWNLMLAATSIALIPMLIVYLFLNKYFISGLMSGAVKG